VKPEYRERFLRSMGIMNERQLAQIKATKIAIGGLGLGGSIFINLVRTGFENFHVADPDTYERTNINRQRLAKETTVGLRKDDALIKEALEINPDLQITTFRDGVSKNNVGDFLEGVDWVVDVVDVFAVSAKLALNAEANKRGLPIVSCGAIGFGASVVAFDRTTPTFAELSGMNESLDFDTNVRRFVDFICPEIPDYMADQIERALRRESHIPFVVPGVEIAAAIAVSEIAKEILGLGERVLAPFGIYVDPVEVSLKKFKVGGLKEVASARRRAA
jgi:molybdopterin/thiamine biosynthesis adenylyltransferase